MRFSRASLASVRPKAIELTGEAARRISLTGNVLTDVESDHARFVDSAAAANVPSGPVETAEPKSP